MNDTEQQAKERLEAARRRLAEAPEPVPFWGSSEFRRVGGLMLLLVLVGGFGVYLYRERLVRSEREAQQAAEQAVQGSPVAADPELRERRKLTLFEGALADSENGTDFRETAGYYTLLRSLAAYPPDEVQAKAQRWLDYEGSLRDPDGWRGEFVRHRGIIADMETVRLSVPVIGIQDVYRGYIMETDWSERVVFDLVGEPPAFREMWDAWDIEGVFYRTLRYEGRDGQVRELPWIIARTMRAAQPGDRRGILEHPLMALVVVAGLALLLTRLLLLLARKRRPARASAAGIGQLFAERRRAAQRAAPKPPDPPSS